ncbi:MAG: rod shape-determining protein [Clostridia bacterium]|nr:rod shape-determining protein [Clostridia bacterium]
MRNIAIDLGTSNTVIFMAGRGIVLNEPTVLTVDANDLLAVAAGEAAKKMMGRTGETLEVIRPLKAGVIADFAGAVGMLKVFMKKAFRQTMYSGNVALLAVPSVISAVEKRAATEALARVGAKNAVVIESSLAAALGAGLAVSESGGSMVVHIGGGTTEIAVITLGKIAVGTTLRYGGDDIDEEIINYIKKEKNILIGALTAEKIKTETGGLSDYDKTIKRRYRGRDLISGLPRSFSLSGEEIHSVFEAFFTHIADEIKSVADKTPPELTADVIDKGFTLTGGGANVKGAVQFLTEQTNFKCVAADEPQLCAIKGLGKMLEEKTYKRFLE